MTDDQLEKAHHHSSYHRREIEASHHVGCFYCQRLYPPTQIQEWVDGGVTALCPHCGIDSVIGSLSGYLDNFAEFLVAMHDYWFRHGTCGRCDGPIDFNDVAEHKCP